MGIHGRPYVAWDGVTDPQGNTNVGYCTHGSLLFPMWHRAYIAFWEQTIVGYATKIANTYPDSNKAAYVAAAGNLKLPYWDWITSPSAMPDVCNMETIQITTPQGSQSVPNPLYLFTFPEPPSSDPSGFPSDASDGWLAAYNTTVRSPDNSGTSQPEVANKALAQGGFQEAVYNLFSRVKEYSNFSTTATSGSSLEGIHNSVHMDVGGQGHMAYLSYAGYDPIFLLHHVNEDRIFALWQAINPDGWIPDDSSDKDPGAYATASGVTDNGESHLPPFAGMGGSATTFWTPNGVRSTKTFGYTYPEIEDWTQTPEQLAANVTSQVNVLYGGGHATPQRAKQGKQGRQGGKGGRLRMKRDEDGGGEDEDDSSTPSQWFVRMSCKRTQTPKQVRVLLNDCVVGQMTIFPLAGDVGQSQLVHSEIPLAQAMEEQGDTANCAEDIIKSGLTWKAYNVCF